jgi:hypothetical protein
VGCAGGLGVADAPGAVGIGDPVDPPVPVGEARGTPFAVSPPVHASASRANESATTDARLDAWTAWRIDGERTRLPRGAGWEPARA